MLFAVVSFLILDHQANTVFSYEKARYSAYSEAAEESIAELDSEIQVMKEFYERGLREKAGNISILLENTAERQALSKAAEICETDFIFVADESGIVTAAVRESMVGSEFSTLCDENNGNYRFAVKELNDGRTLCYGESVSVFDEQIDSMSQYGLAVGEMEPNSGALTFLTYFNDGEPYLLYYNHDGKVYRREPISKIGLDESVMADGFDGSASICGIPHLINTRLIKTQNLGDIYLVTAYFYIGPVDSTNIIVLWEVLLLFLCLAALLCYGYFLENGSVTKSRYFGKLLRVSVIMILLFLGVGMYTQTLELISDAASASDFNALLLEQRLDGNAEMDDSISSFCSKDRQTVMELASQCINSNPDSLKDGIENIYRVENENGMRENMLDMDGNPVVSYAQCRFLQRLSEENSDAEIVVFNYDGYAVSTNGERWYLSYKDTVDGMDLSGCLDVIDGRKHFHYSVNEGYSLSAAETDNGAVVMLANDVNNESGRDRREELIINASKALTDAEIVVLYRDEDPAPDSINRFGNLDLKKYFLHTSYFNDEQRYAISLFDTDTVFKVRNQAVPVETLYCGASFLLIILLMTVLYKPADGAAETQKPEGIRGRYDFKRWPELCAEEKLHFVVSVMMFFVALLIGFVVVKAKVSPERSSAIGYIMTGDWERGVNFFSIAACGVALFTAYAVQLVVRAVIRFSTSELPEYRRAKSNFLASVFAVVLFAIAVLFCLYYIGLDVKGLFASAGIMAAVVGVASKESISSLMKGAMNIYLDKYRVGEYVEVGGFSGYITQMNLTGIVIEDLEGNIKSVSSSDLKGLVNQSRKDTIQRITVPVSQDNKIEDIDRIMTENLEELDGKFEGILTQPTVYLGLSGVLSNYNREVAVLVTCKDEDSLLIKNKYCMEITELLIRNDVKFPAARPRQY